MNLIATLSLVLIALASLLLVLAIYGRLRQGSGVLAALAGASVVLERRDGVQLTGILQATAAGLELQSAIRGAAGQPALPASILLYAVEYDAIESISRETADAAASRRQSYRQTRLHRFLNRLGDAVDGLLSRQARVTAWDGVPGDALAPRRILGYDGNRWDPMLARSLGQRVIFHCVLGNAQYERMGVLGAYDQRFLLLTDVLLPRSQVFPLPQSQTQVTTDAVHIRRSGSRLEIRNRSPYPLLLDELHMAEKNRELGMMIEPGASFSIHTDQPLAAPCELRCQIVHQVDMILPRRTTLIRYRTATADILPLFDAGILLQPDASLQTREEELRWELRQHPQNALAAASLGRLLYRKGQWPEAESYLQQALQTPKSLPDSGQRLRLELIQLQRRQGNPSANQS